LFGSFRKIRGESRRDGSMVEVKISVNILNLVEVALIQGLYFPSPSRRRACPAMREAGG
jgi:hypothetical protein